MNTLTIGLVGNPNCGKSTVFNALTGGRQHVGNWPGVTVERKSGFFKWENATVEVVDLPGIYSLTSVSADSSIDERIACDYILKRQANIIVNILDASNLERSLYLTVQLLEMGVPVILALNMMDVARQRQIKILVDQFAKEFNCPVVTLEASKSKGISELKKVVVSVQKTASFEKKVMLTEAGALIQYPDLIMKIVAQIAREIPISPTSFPVCETAAIQPFQLMSPLKLFSNKQRHCERSEAIHLESKDSENKFRFTKHRLKAGLLRFARNDEIDDASALQSERIGGNDINTQWLALRLLEEDLFVRQFIPENILQNIPGYQQTIRTELDEDSDIVLADARYRTIKAIVSRCIIATSKERKTFTTYIDRIVLHRLLGIPIFLAVMYCMFLFAINIGGAFQDFFDIGSNTLFVGGVAQVLTQLHAPTWLIALLANGVGKGINTTVTFIPVIGAMFLFLALLEDSGYMARAAFVIDRLMRALGLPGKSFVPMIVGFGCNVPAVMAARTLENKRDRILTVMMSPFMSCGARLAIYAVFTAAFFPVGGQNVIFVLYMIGIALAMLTGLLLRKTLLQGEPAPLIMELPAYHLPNLRTLGLHAWQRLKGFVFRAGKYIVPICVLLGALGSLNVGGTLSTGEGDAHSLLSVVGRTVTPVFAPMGIQQDNWPATVGLLTGVLAKEVVIGTLNALYTQVGHLANITGATFHFWGGLQDAAMSIPTKLSELGNALGNPVLAKAPVHAVSQTVYGVMAKKFDGQIGAMAYLLFVLLYFPCVSTTAAMFREVNRGWALFSVVWTTSVAYGAAVAFYQLATWARHPAFSFMWVASIASVFILIVMGMRFYSTRGELRGQYELA